MSRYVIELRPDCKVVQEICESDGKVSIGAKSIEYFEELNADYINEHYGSLQDDAYQRGLEDGKQTAVGAAELREKLEYQKGFKDGKAIHEKGCDGCEFESRTNPDAPCLYCSNNFKNLWRSKKPIDDKIEVGDEVTDLQSGANFVVTHLWKNNHGEMGVSGFNGDCSAFSATFNKVKKTGRHFNIDKILEDMRHD